MSNLKRYREQAGITQKYLAEVVGISLRTLQDYEQGRKPLGKAAAITVLNLSRVLGCTVEDLIAPSTPMIDRVTYTMVQAKLKEERAAETAPPPLGYKPQNGELVADEGEAEVVKRALKETAELGALRPETYKALSECWKRHYSK